MTQYDDVPAAYARRVVPRYVPIAQLVADRCAESLASAQVVVEVAAGTGLLTGLLEPVLPRDTRYVATDISAAMLRLARAQPGADRIPHVCADAFAMPFPDGATDLVVSSLGPLQEDVRTLSEALRLLAPGGHLVLSMWGTGYSELVMLQAARHRLRLGAGAAAPVEAATAGCAGAGFTDGSATSFRLEVSHPSVPDYLAYRRS